MAWAAIPLLHAGCLTPIAFDENRVYLGVFASTKNEAASGVLVRHVRGAGIRVGLLSIGAGYYEIDRTTVLSTTGWNIAQTPLADLFTIEDADDARQALTSLGIDEHDWPETTRRSSP